MKKRVYFMFTYANEEKTGLSACPVGLRSSDPNEMIELYSDRVVCAIEDSLVHRFRLLDEDGVVLFRGYSDAISSVPLQKMCGFYDAEHIEYKDKITGVWYRY